MHIVENSKKLLNFKDYTILIIDDNSINLRVLVEHLKSVDFKIEVAQNGEIGLEMVQSVQPDIILLDVMMPGIDGFETCRRLKATESGKDIPVIFMTALETTKDKLKGFEAGCVDYVTRPIRHEEVLARIITHLRIRDLTLKLQKANQELYQTLDYLKTTQAQLVESEKMASLGALVAGIAHEVNTPIGIGITAASTLAAKTKNTAKIYHDKQLKGSALDAYFDTAIRSSRLIFNNLERAGELIQNFKQVAVDQTNLKARTFAIKQYLQDTLDNLNPYLKNTSHQVIVNGDDNVEIESYPGAFSQIVTNLVVNSLNHAYPTGNAGHLCFNLHRESDYLIIEYDDDGCGISPDNLKKIFEPFFTTGRSQGGTGLGLHIVYNLVTQKLKGTIQVESEVGVGTKFIVGLPFKITRHYTDLN
ncbi:hybrid sensor histidine kinase/response regulator [Candidatus Parabeggiatoa sp. HSG14]|uniref:sensor histidine kinase n=1 Tax=Candidatus Parabeggiatoa sp. HSG14 TaxID=3055593 RepID=UPI0025A8A7B6|nr:hybrid sensor histidine kinase/response regulator [Thiotrichales bacterium HSG14]